MTLADIGKAASSKPMQVIYHALIITAQSYLVAKRLDLVPVFTPGLAVLSGGLGFTLQSRPEPKDPNA